MTAGLSLLKKLCAQQSRTFFRQVNQEHFLEEERPAYEYVNAHYRTYGQLPTMEALADNGFGFPLIRDAETAQYYMDRMGSRYIVMQSRDVIAPLQQAIVNGDANQIAEIITNLGGAIRHTQGNGSVMTLAEALEGVLDAYQLARANPGIQGVTFGYDWLDDMTGGVQAGDLVTIAARTNVGKSYLLNHFALSSWLSGASVLVISMEMTGLQMTTRALAQYTGINPDLIRRGTLSHWTEQRMYAECQAMTGGAPFVIVDGSFSLSVDQVDRYIQEFNPDIVYIDAAYLLIPENKRFTERGWERQREMSKDMKRMGMARGKGIVQTVQLNKDAVLKKSSQLDVGMIGGTDGIAQDSQTVIMMAPGPSPREETTRDLVLGKNREGAKGWMRINFGFDPVDFSYLTCDNEEQDALASGNVQQAPAGWSA